MKHRIIAYQVAESLNIRKIRAAFDAELLEGNPFELFYKPRMGGYLLVLDYGVVVFSGPAVEGAPGILDTLKGFASGFLAEPLTDDLLLESGASRPSFTFDSVKVASVSPAVFRIAMLNVGQSVGLDYYSSVSQKLLDETLVYYEKLEKTGRLGVPKRELVRFIGKAMNIRGKIIDNIYILGEPETVWEDEILNKINKNLQEVLDIRTRFHELDYQQQTVLDNLRMLTDLVQHRESNWLELIIIALILIEVVNLIYTWIVK